MARRRKGTNETRRGVRGMLSVRDFAVLLVAVLVATAAGVLTWLAGGHPAAAFIAAGAGFAGGFELADRLIKRNGGTDDGD